MVTEPSEKKHREESYYIIKLYEDLIHDLKTPLSMTLNSLQQLEVELKKKGFATARVNDTRKGLYRVMKLLGDVSDRAKINHGKMIPKYRNIDMVSVVKDIIELTIPLSERKDISLRYVGRDRPKCMAADKGLFERILLNLLSNAIKFTDKHGQVMVDLQVMGDNLLLSVKDDGKGVSDDMMDKIFMRYAHEDSMRNKSGEGIGLPIVKELAELMGGSVFFTSSRSGTEISVQLPIFLTEEPEEELRIEDFYSSKIVQIELSDDY